MPFFQPSSSERRGFIVLSIVLLVAVAIGWLGRNVRTHEAERPDAPSYGSGRKTPRFYRQPERQLEEFPFDPNTADSSELLRLGLTPSMVRGIYKFRSMGYTYSEPADFSRVPGMTNELWERLKPYIHIDPRFQRVKPEPRSYETHTQTSATPTSVPAVPRDTVRFPRKLQVGSKVELNSSDTSQLKKIPGIGSYYAKKIVYYRQQLGGYASISQLEDIEGIPEGIGEYLTLNTSAVRKIDVNHATKNQLVRHPYLRVYRAAAIWDYRHKYGALKSLDDLRRLPDFSEEDVRRLAPYLEFR